MEVILTIEEVASFLRTEPALIESMLQAGELQGFKLGNDWRIPGVAVTEFLTDRLKNQQIDSLRRSLEDPRTWAREVRRDPKMFDWLDGKEFAEGTMGNFLQKGLAQLDQEEKAENVVPFKKPGES